jgi:hypothetical protein
VSATEIIAEIRKLPKLEQQQVLAFLQQSRPTVGEVQYVADADFDRAADKILRERAGLFRRLAQ